MESIGIFRIPLRITTGERITNCVGKELKRENKMARKKKSPVEAAIDASFKRLGNNVQFNIMDLNPMFNEVRAAVHTAIGNADISYAKPEVFDAAMSAAIAKFRKN